MGRVFPKMGSNNFTQSPIEEKLVSALQRFGVEVICQHPIGPFLADIYIKEDRLVIECDGAEWHKDKEKDAKRDRFMREKGYSVIRFTGKEISKDAESYASRIVCGLIGTYPQHERYLEQKEQRLTDFAQGEMERLEKADSENRY